MMKHKYSLLTGMFLSAAMLLHAQIPLMWGSRYNAPPDMADDSRSIAVDPSGNVYVTGSGFNAAGNLDCITIKYNPNGSQAWVRNYDRGISDNDEGQKLVIDASGNVYVVGYSKGSGTNLDAMAIKYDNAGNQQWVSFYNGVANGLDEGRSIAVNSNGDVFICGYTSDSAQAFDALTVKFNAAGAQQWAQVYDGPISGNDELLNLVIDGSSNVYVTGNTESASFNYDCLTICYNSSGTQQWLQAFDGGAGGDYGKALTIDASGNVLVAAQSGMTNQWFDYLTIKYNSAGVQQWTARYNNGTNRYEDAWGIVTDNAGYVYITGQSQATGNSSAAADFATVKYTPAGNQIWVQRYDGGTNGDDRGYAIVIDDTANVYVAGYSRNATNNDFMTIKYDSSGTMEFALRFNSAFNGTDAGRAIAIENGDIYVTGQSANAANDDFLTLRYSYSAVGITEQSMNVADISAFPVPAENLVTLDLNASAQSASTLILTDLTGRTILSQQVEPGTEQVQLDLSGISAGTYTVTLLSEQGEVTGRSRVIRK